MCHRDCSGTDATSVRCLRGNPQGAIRSPEKCRATCHCRSCKRRRHNPWSPADTYFCARRRKWFLRSGKTHEPRLRSSPRDRCLVDVLPLFAHRLVGSAEQRLSPSAGAPMPRCFREKAREPTDLEISKKRGVKGTRGCYLAHSARARIRPLTSYIQ